MAKYMSTFREIDDDPAYRGRNDHEESNWPEKEIDSLKKRLSQCNNNKQKMRVIEAYLSEEDMFSHNIRGRLVFYSASYFKYKTFFKNHPEIMEEEYLYELLPKKQQKELTELNYNFQKSVENEINEIGLLSYFGKIRNELFLKNYNLPPNIKILKFLFDEWSILILTAESDGPAEAFSTLHVDKKEISPLAKLLIWTETADLREHLKKLKEARIILYNDIDKVLNLEEKIKINSEQNNRGYWAKSIYIFWAENDFAKCAVPKKDKKYRIRQGQIFEKIFEGMDKKSFAEYTLDYIGQIEKILIK